MPLKARLETVSTPSNPDDDRDEGLARGFIHRLGYCSATRGSEGDGNFNCAGVDCHSTPARAR
jgi:hypothetical protein